MNYAKSVAAVVGPCDDNFWAQRAGLSKSKILNNLNLGSIDDIYEEISK